MILIKFLITYFVFCLIVLPFGIILKLLTYDPEDDEKKLGRLLFTFKELGEEISDFLKQILLFSLLGALIFAMIKF